MVPGAGGTVPEPLLVSSEGISVERMERCWRIWIFFRYLYLP